MGEQWWRLCPMSIFSELSQFIRPVTISYKMNGIAASKRKSKLHWWFHSLSSFSHHRMNPFGHSLLNRSLYLTPSNKYQFFCVGRISNRLTSHKLWMLLHMDHVLANLIFARSNIALVWTGTNQRLLGPPTAELGLRLSISWWEHSPPIYQLIELSRVPELVMELLMMGLR